MSAIVSMHPGVPDDRLTSVRPLDKLPKAMAIRIDRLYDELLLLLLSAGSASSERRQSILTELVAIVTDHRPQSFAEFWWYSDFTAMLMLVRDMPPAFCVHKSKLIMHTFQTPTELWDACPIKINLLARTLFELLANERPTAANGADADASTPAAAAAAATTSTADATTAANGDDSNNAADAATSSSSSTTTTTATPPDGSDVYNLCFVVQQICNLNRLAYYVSVSLLWAALYRFAGQSIPMFRMHRLADLLPLLQTVKLERPLELPLCRMHRLLTLLSVLQSLVVLRKPRHEEYVCFRAFFRVTTADLRAITAWLQQLKEKMEFVGAQMRENEDCLQIIEMLDLDILHFMEQKLLDAVQNGETGE